MAIKSTITGSTAINATINKPETVKTTSAVLQQSRASLSLENVDNTRDLNKPISTATQAALDLKLDRDSNSPFLRGTTYFAELQGANGSPYNYIKGSVLSGSGSGAIALGIPPAGSQPTLLYHQGTIVLRSTSDGIKIDGTAGEGQGTLTAKTLNLGANANITGDLSVTGNITDPTFTGTDVTIETDSDCPTLRTQVKIRGSSLIGQYSSPAGSTAGTSRGDVFTLHGPYLNNFYDRVSDTPIIPGANIELFGALPSNATRFNHTRKAFYDARSHTFRDSDANPQMLVIDSNLSPSQSPGESNIADSLITSHAPFRFVRSTTFDDTPNLPGIKLTSNTLNIRTELGLGNVTNESKATMFTSAALTGTPTTTTAAAGTNTTQIASTAFVNTAIANNSPNYEVINVTDINVSGTATGISKSMVGLGNVENKSAATIIGEITASDIPSLATSKITSGTFANARIAESNVTQHQSALSIAATQITGEFDSPHIPKLSTEDITTGTFADARIAASNVTQHQAALSIGASQLTGTLDSPRIPKLSTGDITTGTFADARIAESNVTQHKAAAFASAALTGTPTAPTASAGTNTTQIATTAYTTTAISNLVDSAPGTLNTLNEIAAALNDSPAQIDNILSAVGQRLVIGNNLSDLNNAGTARTNLGLGNVENKSAATIIGEITAGDIPSLAASKITSGVFDSPRIPKLSTTDITTGTFADARIAASNVTQHLGTAGTLDVGISENNIAQFNATAADDDFLRIDGTKVEGRSASEVKSDLSLNNVTNESKATMFTDPTFTGAVSIDDHISAPATSLLVKLTSAGSETLPLRVQNDATGSSSVGIGFTISTTDSFKNAKIVSSRVGGAAVGDLQFYTNDGTSLASRLTISKDGKVSIGDSPAGTPQDTLDVTGTLRVRGTAATEQSVLKLGQLDSNKTSGMYEFETIDDGGDTLNIVSKRYVGEVVFKHQGPAGEMGFANIRGNYQSANEIRLLDQLNLASNTMTKTVSIKGMAGQKAFFGADRGSFTNSSPNAFLQVGINTGDNIAAGKSFHVKGESQFDSPVTFTTASGANKGLRIKSSNKSAGIAIGGQTNHGVQSVLIGQYGGSTGAYTSAPGLLQVAIGSGGIIHSGASFAIGIGAYHQLNSASASRAIGIGSYATATKSSAIAIGALAQAQADRSIVIGTYSVIHASAADAIAIGYNADANNANSLRAIAIGRESDASHNDTIALGANAQSTAISAISIGHDTDATGAEAIAIGDTSQALQSNATAIGANVKSNVVKVTEIGYWSDATTRGGAVTIRGVTGQVSATLQDRSSAYTDGGATKGSEADNTLMREAYSVRRSGTKLFADLNIGGTISTHQLSNDSPTFTGLTTLEKVRLNTNAFETETSSFTLSAKHAGAIVFCNNTAPMIITVPSQTSGFTTTFIAKTNNAVNFTADSPNIGLNSFNGAGRLAGFAAQASITYDSPSSAFLGGTLI
jgi:hypothetical protein